MYDDRIDFCGLSFIDKIFMFGGLRDGITNSCLQFDTKDHNWKEVAPMNEARYNAACVVFEGRIVLSGGRDNTTNKLNIVESFDVIADEWSPMPNMINRHGGHRLIVVRNKLFVIGIGRDNCEVFDNNCKKFISLKPHGTNFGYLKNVISVGSKIFVLLNRKKNTLVRCYDVERDKWSTKNLKYDITSFCCVKLPWF